MCSAFTALLIYIYNGIMGAPPYQRASPSSTIVFLKQRSAGGLQCFCSKDAPNTTRRCTSLSYCDRDKQSHYRPEANRLRTELTTTFGGLSQDERQAKAYRPAELHACLKHRHQRRAEIGDRMLAQLYRENGMNMPVPQPQQQALPPAPSVPNKPAPALDATKTPHPHHTSTPQAPPAPKLQSGTARSNTVPPTSQISPAQRGARSKTLEPEVQGRKQANLDDFVTPSKGKQAETRSNGLLQLQREQQSILSKPPQHVDPDDVFGPGSPARSPVHMSSRSQTPVSGSQTEVEPATEIERMRQEIAALRDERDRAVAEADTWSQKYNTLLQFVRQLSGSAEALARA